MNTKYVSFYDAAEALGVGAQTVYRWYALAEANSERYHPPLDIFIATEDAPDGWEKPGRRPETLVDVAALAQWYESEPALPFADSERSIPQAAKELDVPERTLYTWALQTERDTFPAPPADAFRRVEVQRAGVGNAPTWAVDIEVLRDWLLSR